MIEEEKSSTYNPQYREDQSLNEQNIKRESLSMIALFHLNYWCNSDEEKRTIKTIISKNNEEKHQADDKGENIIQIIYLRIVNKKTLVEKKKKHSLIANEVADGSR